MNYKVSIIAELTRAIAEHPTLSIGEILHEVKWGTGKPLLEITDKEFYSSLEKVINTNYDDAPMTEDEFKVWADK